MELWELVGMSPSEPTCKSECLCDTHMAHRWSFMSPFFLSRMRERDLQSMCRRALLLTVCMVSLWGQLSSASSHRSHIGNVQHSACSSGLFLQGMLTNHRLLRLAATNRVSGEAKDYKNTCWYNFVHSYCPYFSQFPCKVQQKQFLMYFGKTLDFLFKCTGRIDNKNKKYELHDTF